MRIGIFQYDIKWMNPDANNIRVEDEIKKFCGDEKNPKLDLLVLPEMYNVGFSTDAHNLAEEMAGKSLSKIKSLAKEYGMAICGSLPIKEDGNVFNRCFFITEDGAVSHYDKKHLFSIGMEREAFSGGEKQTIVSYKGWNINLSVCYDVRFPVWMRNTGNNYDILINVANWPTVRIDSWLTLLKARAIENQAYVCGANRIGVDNLCLEYNGQSTIFDFKGKAIASAENEEKIIIAEFDKEALEKFRRKFPVWKDADMFEIKTTM